MLLNKKVLLILVSSFLPFSAWTAGLPKSGNYLGLGYIFHNSGSVATSATSGAKPLFANPYSQITYAHFLEVGGFILSPNFSLGLFSRKSPDGSQKTSVSSLGLRAHSQISSDFDWHYGLGSMAYTIKGSEGTKTLDNGSSTAEFGLPGGSRTSSLLYLDFGLALQHEKFRFEFSVYITKLFDGKKRALNPYLTATYEIF